MRRPASVATGTRRCCPAARSTGHLGGFTPSRCPVFAPAYRAGCFLCARTRPRRDRWVRRPTKECTVHLLVLPYRSKVHRALLIRRYVPRYLVTRSRRLRSCRLALVLPPHPPTPYRTGALARRGSQPDLVNMIARRSRLTDHREGSTSRLRVRLTRLEGSTWPPDASQVASASGSGTPSQARRINRLGLPSTGSLGWYP
jgi:hypothetical protein